MSTAFLRRAHFLQKGSLVKGGLSRIQEQVRDRGILYGLPPGFRWFRKINVGRGYPKGISSHFVLRAPAPAVKSKIPFLFRKGDFRF